MPGLVLASVARVPLDGVAAFQSYETAVLPLLREHAGTRERRLRNSEGTLELHIVRFATREEFEKFRADPRRLTAAPLLAKSGAVVELMELKDVD
jgi:molybdopterin biosynthesis enzyme